MVIVRNPKIKKIEKSHIEGQDVLLMWFKNPLPWQEGEEIVYYALPIRSLKRGEEKIMGWFGVLTPYDLENWVGCFKVDLEVSPQCVVVKEIE